MKWFALFISLLLVFPSLAQNEIKTSSNITNVLYVGGSGKGNYTSIQDAINDAKDGYIVYVYPGIYNESIVINKSISLIGIEENGGKPVINGNGSKYAIKVEVNNTVIKNFRIFAIRGGGWSAGIWIKHCSNVTTENNNIICDYAPIWMNYCNRITVLNNTISGGEFIGINSQGGNKNRIIHNILTNNGRAISISGTYNTISYNEIYNNSKGIELMGSFNEISYNKVYGNKGRGIEISGLFGISNEVFNNLIYENNMGLYLGGYFDHVYSNNISRNSRGIYIHGACYNIIENNTIYKNSWSGVEMEGTGAEINFPVVNNTIRYNKIVAENANVLLIWFYCYNNYFIKNDFIKRNIKRIEWEEVIVNINASLKLEIQRNYYNGNYWYGWNSSLPKPIKAKWTFKIFGKTILSINGYIFDWHPAVRPNCS